MTEFITTVVLLVSMYLTARLYPAAPNLGVVYFFPGPLTLKIGVLEEWVDIGYSEDGWTLVSADE